MIGEHHHWTNCNLSWNQLEVENASLLVVNAAHPETACFTFLMKKLFCWPWLPLIQTVSITNQTEIIPAMWFQLIASLKVIWLISSTRIGAAIEDDNYKRKTNDSLSWESGRRPVYRKTGRPSGLQNSDFFWLFSICYLVARSHRKTPRQASLNYRL